MSQMVTDVVDITAAFAGIVLAPVTGGASLVLTATGASDLYRTNVAAQAAETDTHQIAPNPVPTAGGQYTNTGQNSAQGNTPGATGTVTVPDEQTVVNERADAANLAQVSYEEQGLTSIENLKVQEQQQEGAIVAGAAARGLKLSGSPLYQLNAQKEAGATAIGSAETQFSLGDRAQSEQTLAGFNAGVFNMSNQNLAIQTDLSNQWLSSFTNLINTASSFLGKFWNPAQTMQSTGNNWNTNSAYDQSGAGYTPYMSEY